MIRSWTSVARGRSEVAEQLLLCMGQLKSLERRLQKDETLRKRYQETIDTDVPQRSSGENNSENCPIVCLSSVRPAWNMFTLHHTKAISTQAFGQQWDKHGTKSCQQNTQNCSVFGALSLEK